MLERKLFLYKIYKCMKGFATLKDIIEEYNYLEKIYNCPQLEMVDNIKNWVRWNYTDTDEHIVILERLERENL